MKNINLSGLDLNKPLTMAPPTTIKKERGAPKRKEKALLKEEDFKPYPQPEENLTGTIVITHSDQQIETVSEETSSDNQEWQFEVRSGIDGDIIEAETIVSSTTVDSSLQKSKKEIVDEAQKIVGQRDSGTNSDLFKAAKSLAETVSQRPTVPQDKSSLKSFSEQIFSNLPERIVLPFVEMEDSKQQKDLMLIVLLIVAGGTLKNYKGMYDGTLVEANIFLLIIAPAGEGKGSVKHIIKIWKKIHNRLKKEHESEMKMYFQKIRDIKAGLEDGEIGDLEKPVLKRLIIPGNITKPAFGQLLQQNGGRANMFESEIDTFSVANNQQHGGFTDLVRRAFQHESYSEYRKTGEAEFEIDELFLTMILTGTFGQVQNLIPSTENGLFSRFTAYELLHDASFHDVFDSKRNKIGIFFDEYAEFFDVLYQSLDGRESHVTFMLTSQQAQVFVQTFGSWKAEDGESISDEAANNVHRIALMSYRIMMILSMMRLNKNRDLPDTIQCQDVDFENAIAIMTVLHSHMLSVYFQLTPVNEESENNDEEKNKRKELKKMAKELHIEGLTVRAIAAKIGSTKSTVSRMLNERDDK